MSKQSLQINPFEYIRLSLVTLHMAKPKHDPFFSRSLEYPSIAKSFLFQHTPNHLKEYVNWKALDRVDRSNTDPKLKKLHRDMLYKASLKQDKDIIFGIEHQSKPDSLMPIRYLRYDANILEAYAKEGQTNWPLIINLLLYNGSKAPYPYQGEPLGYYRHNIEGQEQLYLFFYLLDLTQASDKELLTHGICAPMKILLKHCHDGNFEEPIEAYKHVFNECIKEIGDDYIVSMLEYADSLKDYEIGGKMHKFVEEVFQNKQEVIMTYGQLLKREARQEGRKEGRKNEKLAIAKNMLQDGEAIEKIVRYTGLSREDIEKLKQE